MVAVYDVVEIAGISHGMISKTLAYDLNRNHTMRCRSRDISHDVRCRGRDISLLRRDVTEAEKRNHADFCDFCPEIFTFSDHCLFVILGASHAHNTRQLLGSQSFTVSRGPTSGRIVLFVQRPAALKAQGCRAPPRATPRRAHSRLSFLG